MEKTDNFNHIFVIF